ncbi:MAG: hypothetical protein K5870_06060 [Lachnospiraceae bacterium]|nr:hypothetical protein [Lachnospiraceae bacterium]
MNASVTVEAAFIVPFILFVTLVSLVFIFMFYNRIKLTGDINYLLEYAGESEQVRGKVDQAELMEHWRKLSANGYLFCSTSDPVIEIKWNEVSISAELEMITPVGKLCEKMVGLFGVTKINGSISLDSRETKMKMIDAGQELLK